MKVLIVDDNADDRRLLRCNLERHGCETVIEARDGQEGFDLARTHRPALIVSDALMPRLDGFQLLRMLKTDEELKAIPFVFHSSVYTGLKDEELAFRLGAEAFIPKPKEPEEFWGEIAAILENLAAGKRKTPPPRPMAEEKEYLTEYSGIVAAKLEVKVKELEESLALRKEAEEAIRASLREKEVLLKEIHHRVKNNLQIICSLLGLQAARLEPGAARETLRDSENRVRSMALIHEMLYQSADLAQVDFSAYVEQLCTRILRSHASAADRIGLVNRVADVVLELDQAIPCGLIINELVSNALKHAFDGDRTGTITVELAPGVEGSLTLRVSDDGVGFAAGFDPGTSDSLGLRLVWTLARQLGGTVAVAHSGGTAVSIAFDAAVQKGGRPE